MAERVVVVGAGTMGAGIAQVLAQAGLRVTLLDPDPAALRRAEEVMARSVRRLADRGRIHGPASRVLRRVETVAASGEDVPPCRDVSVAIEAVPEDLALKRGVLRSLQRACAPGALLATNTSGLPVGEIAAELDDSSAVVGLHFFNPVPMMPAVEVVRGPESADAAVERGLSLVRRLGKEPLLVRRDIPGFVLNRIAMAASNEAMRLVQDGVATAEEIDRGVRGAFGWRMGPLETADLVGLDVVLAAREAIHRRTGDDRFEPPRILRELVAAGHLGRKSGGGFRGGSA